MGYLAVSEQQKALLDQLNDESPDIKVTVQKGVLGGWLTSDVPLPDAVEGGYLQHFAEWYASLSPVDDLPAPWKKPTPRPRPPRE